MLKPQTQTNLFRMMSHSEMAEETIPSNARIITQNDFLRTMNDPAKKAEYDNRKLLAKTDPRPLKTYGLSDTWGDFVGTTFLDGILEHTTYNAVSDSIAARVDIPTGLTFVYREFENFVRAQHGGEGMVFERTQGQRRTQEVPIHTIGLRSWATEESIADLPFSAMELETRIMGSSIALEQDLLWIDSLNDATSGQNATDFNNSLQASGVDLEMLLGIINWFFQPFDATLTSITLTDPFDNSVEAEQVESLMRLGRFKVTDVLLNPKRYFDVINNAFLQSQNIWTNSRILDSGALEVPMLGARFHRLNIGAFSNPDDVNSWVADDSIYFLDRNQLGGGTIGVRQPMTVRNWTTHESRTEDVMAYTRLGFAVQNRRALIKVSFGS